MRKKLTLFTAFVLIAIFIASQIKAETALENLNPKEKVEEIENKVDATKEKTEYLKKEWNTLLINNKIFGPIIKLIDSVFTALNPFFQIVLKIDYSFSFAFILGLIIWITLFIFIYQPSKQIINNQLIGILISFILVSIIGYLGIIKEFINAVSLLVTNPWILVIAIIITIIFSLIIIKLGGGLKEIIKKQKEKDEKSEEKEDKRLSHLEAEVKRMEHGLK